MMGDTDNTENTISGVIAIQNANGQIIDPTDQQLQCLKGELEKVGFTIDSVESIGLSVAATRAVIKNALGLDLPNPPYGSYQRLNPTTVGLQSYTLLLEIYGPLRHF